MAALLARLQKEAEACGSSTPPGPKKDDDDDSKENKKEKKHRRIQPLSKTEAVAKIKDRYEHFDNNTYRLKDGAEPIRTPEGKAIKRIEWDNNHFGEWEAYTDKAGGNHVGALDPETLELYKVGVKGRIGSN